MSDLLGLTYQISTPPYMYAKCTRAHSELLRQSTIMSWRRRYNAQWVEIIYKRASCYCEITNKLFYQKKSFMILLQF
jgi:hypothetical protein